VNKISEENIHEEESPVRNASDEELGEMQVEDLNFSVAMLGCRPVKLHGVAKKNRIGCGKMLSKQVKLGYSILKLSLVHGAIISSCPSTLQSLRYICCYQIKKIWVPN
jgi:hypothetical protein